MVRTLSGIQTALDNTHSHNKLVIQLNPMISIPRPPIRAPKKRKSKIYIAVFMLVIFAGTCLRFYAMSRGHNFDFESYKIVGDIVARGGNVYAETVRYNYGPVWFGILGLFREISLLFTSQDFLFRILITGFLTIVDILISIILYKKYSLATAVIFFINPISIEITGFHNQFDNLAVLIGLVGLLLMPKPGSNRLTKQHIYSAVIIGLSLMTKHIFFMLPLWLFIREKSISIKLAMFFIPLTIFGLSFLPFIFNGGLAGIIQNVFLYKSFANAPLLYALFSQGIVTLISPTLVLVLALVIAGFVTRKLPLFEAGLWYLITLVVFSPAIANQYLAIVTPALAVFGAVFFIPFFVIATFMLWGTDGIYSKTIYNLIPDRLLPYIEQSPDNGHYKLVILTLFLGAALLIVYRYRSAWYGQFYTTIRTTLEEQFDQIRSIR